MHVSFFFFFRVNRLSRRHFRSVTNRFLLFLFLPLHFLEKKNFVFRLLLPSFFLLLFSRRFKKEKKQII